jgi:glyoxylase-like metal-dependent hydrolase (beta-lactamase superfamily II)
MRRRFLCCLVLLAGAALAGAPSCPAQQADTAGFRVVPVASGIWMLSGEGGNVALSVGDDATLLVDTDYERAAPRLLAAIRALTPRPVRFVLDTHWHADHTGGNAALAATGAVMVAQDNTRLRLSTEQVMRNFHFPALPPAARPVIGFRDTLTFHLGAGNDAVVSWVGPAHTDGDVVVFWRQANVIHTGDLTCYYAYPFFDEDTGADILGMVAAVDRIVAMSDDRTRIIGGHGPLASRADLVQYRDMLKTIVQRVAAQRAAGRSVADVIASRPTAEFDARWAKPGTMPADTLVALIYRNLRARAGT